MRNYLVRIPEDTITESAHCLIVDDDAQIRRALVRVIEGQGLACMEAGSGLEGLELLGHIGSVPLVITDVHMPGMDGLEFLRELRARYPDTAVIMLTAVTDVRTAVMCLQMGAMDYLAKPVVIDEVRARVTQALERRKLILENRFYQKHLETRVKQQAQRIKDIFMEGVQALAHALEAKDPYTRGHSKRVSMYAVRTAVRLGFTADPLEDIRLGGELHDIGKIDTPESILNKPGPLSPDEFERVMRHVLLGEKILAPFVKETPVVLRIVRSHHERVDGRGFPDGLVGEAIPYEARIVAVADAFDAMTTSRAYRSSRTNDEAFEELRACSGTHFDPEVVHAFTAAFADMKSPPVENLTGIIQES
ncbi:MAG: HD domain-containing phosphohydrolase [Gemmatimonadota bacterium]